MGRGAVVLNATFVILNEVKNLAEQDLDPTRDFIMLG
jgi:hypothetical protein